MNKNNRMKKKNKCLDIPFIIAMMILTVLLTLIIYSTILKKEYKLGECYIVKDVSGILVTAYNGLGEYELETVYGETMKIYRAELTNSFEDEHCSIYNRGKTNLILRRLNERYNKK